MPTAALEEGFEPHRLEVHVRTGRSLVGLRLRACWRAPRRPTVAGGTEIRLAFTGVSDFVSGYF
jgi:hypothetical protein